MHFDDVSFGVVLPTYAGNSLTQAGAETYWGVYDFPVNDKVSWPLVLQTAKRSEELGYESLWAPDHLMIGKNGEILDCWAVLSALSVLTKNVKLGTWVVCNNYRNPALVAKAATTLATISGNRFVLGYGAGWYETEYIAYGYRFPPPGERIEMLREGLEIIRGMLKNNKFSYTGKNYAVREAINTPKPTAKVPILIGGWGKRILNTVAAYADAWDVGADPTPEQYGNMVSLLTQAMKKRGRSMDELTKSIHFHVIIGRDEEEVRVRKKQVVDIITTLEPRMRGGRPYKFEFEKPIVGTPQQVRQKLEPFVKLGCQRFILMFMDYPVYDSLKLFAESI
jgi:alkanesulfonate monooxygenase SsuD/methylene tetrahydromethanopterin reductase-like flavin-dependent oxidoreductase (luciferase family)